MREKRGFEDEGVCEGRGSLDEEAGALTREEKV
ncbi:Uncharacterised protein [Bartonella grahamii]|uniref:Uncharacterized protein n=1 Tax=Bartonella grahamii TaxID=33045 RepID=A0A336NAS2_BARGR|nr:Uncharacterised protein [Bartonella grahamii]